MSILQVAKMSFFWKHFSNNFWYFRIFLSKLHRNCKKWQCLGKNAIFATCKIAICLVIFLYFFVIFCHFSAIFRIMFDNAYIFLRKLHRHERTQKQDGAQHTFFAESCAGVGSCALHEIDTRSLLRPCEHWWYQGPQFTTACCVSCFYSLLVAISAHVTPSPCQFWPFLFVNLKKWTAIQPATINIG